MADALISIGVASRSIEVRQEAVSLVGRKTSDMKNA